MLTEGLVYSQVPRNVHNKIAVEKDSQYYKSKCGALKQKLLQFERENERLIEENCYLLDKNYQYSDTITVLFIHLATVENECVRKVCQPGAEEVRERLPVADSAHQGKGLS